MAESYSELESVCAVARRYGLAQGQLFTWRREMRRALPRIAAAFAPVVVEPPPAPVAPAQPAAKRARRRSRGGGGIELEIDGVVVRVERGADARTVAAVIGALKAGR